MKVKVIHFFVICALLFTCDAITLELFSNKDRHGNSIRVKVNEEECTNLPRAWHRKAASINNFGNCLQLFDQEKCRGKLTVLQPFHTVHQMDLSLVHFNHAAQSVSPCGPKIKQGRYVIQSAQDASILSTKSRRGYFSKVESVTPSSLISKSQQWEVFRKNNDEYFLQPRENTDNYPLSYDESELTRGKIKRKQWKIVSVGRGRYLIKHEASQKCIYKTPENSVKEHDCRIWSNNQEWIFRRIIVNPKDTVAKKRKKIGPGLNLNVLSDVATYRPTRPPLLIELTTPSSPIRRPFSKPYIVRKKIKKGPKPQSLQSKVSYHLSPPGLKPAISAKLANNNNFLLTEHHKLPNPSLKRPGNLTFVNLKRPPGFKPLESPGNVDDEDYSDINFNDLADYDVQPQFTLQKVKKKQKPLNRDSSSEEEHSSNESGYDDYPEYYEDKGQPPSTSGSGHSSEFHYFHGHKYAEKEKEEKEEKESNGFLSSIFNKISRVKNRLVSFRSDKKEKSSSEKDKASLPQKDHEAFYEEAEYPSSSIEWSPLDDVSTYVHSLETNNARQPVLPKPKTTTEKSLLGKMFEKLGR